MQRDAILLSLINEMRAKGSWCGETHIQKSVGVAELERQATALYVTLNERCPGNSRAILITELKPHIKIDQAEKALESVDAMIKEAAEKGRCSGL